MDNLFEIIIVISVIWSIISSLKTKKKKLGQNQPTSTSTSNGGLFAELEQLLEGKHIPQLGIPEVTEFEETKIEEKPEAPKLTSNNVFHEKFERKQALLPKRKKLEAFDFNSPIDHPEHFDTGLDLHSPIHTPKSLSSDSELDTFIDTESLMNPQHIREAILLNEILNKPKSLQHR